MQAKIEYFEILQRTELSTIARLFLGRWGNVIFFTILGLYLFGDLAIYSAVVPKTLLNVICNDNGCFNASTSINESLPCRPHEWPDHWTRMAVYRLLVVGYFS